MKKDIHPKYHMIKVEMTDDEVLDEMRKMGKSSIKKAIKANQVKKKAK